MLRQKSRNDRFGFTLAEVLITLGIIGVVAALTMPNLIANYQKKQTVTQLKKVYSEFSQAALTATLTYGDYEDWDYTITAFEFFNKYFSSFINISEQSVADVKNSGINYIQVSGKPETSFTPLYDASVIKTLPSGTQIFLSNNLSRGIKRKSFVIDLNGFKGPNKFGRDLFVLTFTSKGLVAAVFDDDDSNDIQKDRETLLNGPSEQNYQCNKQGRGMWCAALIIMDGWEIKDDYPW